MLQRLRFGTRQDVVHIRATFKEVYTSYFTNTKSKCVSLLYSLIHCTTDHSWKHRYFVVTYITKVPYASYNNSHALIILIVFLHSVTYKQLLVNQKNETQKAC
jgi:hypothetical protein